MYDIFENYNEKNIPKRIRKLRKLRKDQYNHPENYPNTSIIIRDSWKNQTELGKAIGVERQIISQWENGKSIPQVNNLVKICKELVCSLDYLLGSDDFPEIEPITKASHYSGISPEIIRHGLEAPDYLDYLNFFMNPKNCSALSNMIISSAWKTSWIDSSLSEIKPPFREIIIEAYDEYTAITPLNETNKDSYKSYLQFKFPQNELSLKRTSSDNKYCIKSCIPSSTYQTFFNGKDFCYHIFINYLVDNTFEALSSRAIVELNKQKISRAFLNLFMDYLEYITEEENNSHNKKMN